jgi:hypothetical protein
MMGWQRDGKSLMNKPGYKVVTDGGYSSLTIESVSREDNIWFQCSAINIAGTASTRAKLNVVGEFLPLLLSRGQVFQLLVAAYIPGGRLPPTAVRMNHERLPRHGLYLATSSMTSWGQIWHILNITSSFSATLFWPSFQ